MEENTENTTPAGDKTPVDWEARYKGLDRTFQQKRTDWATEVEGLKKTLQEASAWKEKFESADKGMLDLKKTYEGLMAEHAKALSETATLRDTQERMKMFLTEEFRDLIPFEEKGLLRTDLRGDDFATNLREYKAALGSQQSGKKNVVVPPPPAGRQSTKKEDIRSDAIKEFNKGNTAGYNDLMDRYYAAKE